MLQFVQPWWLLAALTALIPVLIHLWNVREGRTLKVGSVSLLVKSSRQPARSWRLREILLLLLRCALIILLSLFLAGPLWTRPAPAGTQKGWVLLDRERAQEAYTRFKAPVDSLVAAGFELRTFGPGFPHTSGEELTRHTDSLPTERVPSYWGLLRRLQKQMPANLPVYLYTSDRLDAFRGSRPRMALNLRWQTFTPHDSVARWLAAARLGDHDSIRVTEGISTPSAIRYAVRNVSAMQPAGAGYQLDFENGKLMIRSTDPLFVPGRRLEADTAALRMTIYTDAYATDAAYLQAALQAIGQYTHQRLQVRQARDPAELSGSPDWLFWLSDKPVPVGVKAQNLWAYAPGTAQPVRTWIAAADEQQETTPVYLYKLVPAAVRTGWKALWEDGYGRPVLSSTNGPAPRRFLFYSRLNPQWSDLPWSPVFPVWMLRLLSTQLAELPPSADTRRIDPRQIMPEPVAAGPDQPVHRQVWSGLDLPLWIAAFLLLLAERLVSFRKPKNQPDGQNR